MTEARGQEVSISMFVYADRVGENSTRYRQTGVLIFINKSTIHWYSKIHTTVEAITFGAEFCATKAGVDVVEALRYKIIMFGVPIDGYAKFFCDNEAIYNNTITP